MEAILLSRTIELVRSILICSFIVWILSRFPFLYKFLNRRVDYILLSILRLRKQGRSRNHAEWNLQILTTVNTIRRKLFHTTGDKSHSDIFNPHWEEILFETIAGFNFCSAKVEVEWKFPEKIHSSGEIDSRNKTDVMHREIVSDRLRVRQKERES